MTAMVPICRELRAHRLSAQYEKLAHWAVKRFLGFDPKHPDYEDAVQVARLAVFKAGRLFDSARNIKFISYAGRAAAQDLELWNKLRLRHGFRHVGDSPTNAAVTRAVAPVSLDLHVADVGPLAELIPAAQPDRPGAVDGEDLARAMRRLPKRDAAVLHARYWLGETLVEAGRRFGVSRGMIHLIEKRAIARLGELLGADAVAG